MKQTTESQAPLTGLKVIDFGHYYAGPLVGMMLADQGADVIRIVKPGGPELPQQQYRLLNRNKKFLTLNLKSAVDKMKAESLIEHADVLIENFRPGVMKRLGLDYAVVRNKNPNIVYLSLPGFASTDKERAHIQAWEGVLGAAACMFTNISEVRQLLNFPPVYTSIPQCSIYGGMNGAIGVMAALVSREKKGGGTVIEVPLVDAGLQGCYEEIIRTNFITKNTNQVIPDDLLYYPKDSHNIQIKKFNEAWFRMPPPGYSPFLCADGRRVFTWLQDMPTFSENYYKVLEIDRQLARDGFVHAGSWERGMDNNLNSLITMSTKWANNLQQLIANTMLNKPAAEWELILRKAGQLTGFIRTRDEFLKLKPMLDAGVLIKQNNGESELTVPGRLADIRGPEDTVFDISAKELTSITYAEADELFKASSLSPQDKGTFLKKKDLLRGLKVLDMASFLSGPYASYILAQFGADVIKLDETVALPLLLHIPLECGQGKRSLLANVKTAPGQEILKKLIASSDVVIHNLRDDAAKGLGVSHTQLKKINPKVISAHISAFGGTYPGIWDNFKAIEPVAPAISGLWSYYGTLETPLRHGIVSSSDIPGGLSLAFATLLAVFQQQKTGYAGDARTSLVRATSYYQLPWMISENGSSDWGEPRGQFTLGESWRQRLYECKDGWIYIWVSESQASMFTELVTGCIKSEEQKFEAAFIARECAHWLTLLEAANIACHKVLDIADICSQNIVEVSNEEAGYIVDGSWQILRYVNHPSGIPINTKAPSGIRIGNNRSYKRQTPWPGYGRNTKEILKELGYKDEEIEELLHLKIVHEYLPKLGNKDNAYFLE